MSETTKDPETSGTPRRSDLQAGDLLTLRIKYADPCCAFGGCTRYELEGGAIVHSSCLDDEED
jgi:hypothetical protein